MIYNIRFDIYLGKSYDHWGKAGVSNEAYTDLPQYSAGSTGILRSKYFSTSCVVPK